MFWFSDLMKNLPYFTRDQIIILLLEIYILLLLYGLFFLILFHELGHLIFGHLGGFQLNSFRMYSITIYKEKGRYRFGIYSSYGSAGQCLMVPPSKGSSKLRVVFHVLGGIIFDFIAFIILLILSMSPLTIDVGYKAGIFLCSILSLLNVLANGIPNMKGKINNDGTIALHILKDSQAFKSCNLILLLPSILQQGKTYREVEADIITIPVNADLTNPLIIWHKINEAYYYMDQRQWQEAYHCISELEDKMGKQCRAITITVMSEKLFLSILLGTIGSGIKGLGVKGPGVKGPGVKGPGIKDPGVKGPEIKCSGIEESEIKDLYGTLHKYLKRNQRDVHLLRVSLAYEIYKNGKTIDEALHEIEQKTSHYPYKGDVIFCKALLREMI